MSHVLFMDTASTYLEARFFQMLLSAEDEKVGKVGRLDNGNVAIILYHRIVRRDCKNGSKKKSCQVVPCTM